MARLKVVPIDRMQSAIQEALDEYGDGVNKDVEKAVTSVARSGAAALRAESRAKVKRTGRYAAGWRADIRKDRLNPTAELYNATKPGLTHLLEFGHAKVGGGRVAGRAHIAPVEAALAVALETKVARGLA